VAILESPMEFLRLIAPDKLDAKRPISGLSQKSPKGAPGLSEQLTIFAAKSVPPEGLRYCSEFISKATEQELIGRIAALPLKPFQFGQYEGKRRVASFGFRYDYTLRHLEEAEPIPAWLSEVIERVENFGGPATRVRQVLCTEYDTGVGIGWHRDKPHFDRVFGLSLGSACNFRFRRAAGSKWERFTLDATPRSIYMMCGAARQDWEHSIPAVEAPRYSITFRTMAEINPKRATHSF
jgi:alkylated DNA repair dioxygenase AlkB